MLRNGLQHLWGSIRRRFQIIDRNFERCIVDVKGSGDLYFDVHDGVAVGRIGMNMEDEVVGGTEGGGGNFDPGPPNAGGTITLSPYIIQWGCIPDSEEPDCKIPFTVKLTEGIQLNTNHLADPAFTLTKIVNNAVFELHPSCKFMQCTSSATSTATGGGSTAEDREYDLYRPCNYASTDLDVYIDPAVFDGIPGAFSDPVLNTGIADCCYEFVSSGHTDPTPIVVPNNITIYDGCDASECESLPDTCPAAYAFGNALNWKLTAASLTKIKNFFSLLQIKSGGVCTDLAGGNGTEWNGTLTDRSTSNCQWDLFNANNTYYMDTLNAGKADVRGDDTGVALVGAGPDYWNVQLSFDGGGGALSLIWKKPCGQTPTGIYKLARGGSLSTNITDCIDVSNIESIEVEAA